MNVCELNDTRLTREDIERCWKNAKRSKPSRFIEIVHPDEMLKRVREKRELVEVKPE